MAISIDQKIVEYRVKTEGDKPANEPEETNVIQMHEKLERPEMLFGSTYKIKTPLSDHALFITVNDIVLNPDTEHEQRRPFEIFINSKNMEHFQWIVALTRIMSAVFRKGGDVTFLVEELRSVFDPGGGYFKRGGKFMPSLVAEIGEVIEAHMRMIGLMKDEVLDDHQRAHVAEKRAELERSEKQASAAVAPPDDDYPASATLCDKCHTRAQVMMDGCVTCLSCGYSKCG
ncbi:MAG: NrdJb [Chromatiales bacterium]|jgi:hypothetical protein|nr:NrdJb [Chromatiales bacterium]